MATINRFEDLICWQKARELTKEVYKAFKSCNDRGFKDQIQRASVSVISNVSEGFESGTKQGFLNYLYIAKASAGEVRAQLYVAYDIGYLNVKEFQNLKALVESCSRLLSSFIKKLKIGGRSGLQRKHERKEDTWFRDTLKKNGQVFTVKGIMKKEKAEKQGIKIIEDY